MAEIFENYFVQVFPIYQKKNIQNRNKIHEIMLEKSKAIAKIGDMKQSSTMNPDQKVNKILEIKQEIEQFYE